MVWRDLNNRIPTKDNLFRRGVLSHSQLGCVEDCGSEESITHTFFECPVFAGTWNLIYKWISVSSTFHNDEWHHLKQFEN